MNWTSSNSKDGNYVTYYNISYSPFCPELSSFVSVTRHQNIVIVLCSLEEQQYTVVNKLKKSSHSSLSNTTGYEYVTQQANIDSKRHQTGLESQFNLLSQITPGPGDIHCNTADVNSAKNRSDKYLPCKDC